MTEVAFLLLLVVATAFAFKPFWGAREPQVATAYAELSRGRLLRRKDALLQNIADLDFEHSMGKVTDEDHIQLRAKLKSQAARIFEQVEGSHTPGAGKSAASFCDQCGSALPRSARFCPSCGEDLQSG